MQGEDGTPLHTGKHSEHSSLRDRSAAEVLMAKKWIHMVAVERIQVLGTVLTLLSCKWSSQAVASLLTCTIKCLIVHLQRLSLVNSNCCVQLSADGKPRWPEGQLFPDGWEEMGPFGKAWQIYAGERGLLFWANKLAYIAVFVIIGGWVLFRIVGPALGLYQLTNDINTPTKY